MDTSERIIVALDCDAYEARDLAEHLRNQATWLKVGMTLYYQEGPAIIKDLKRLGFKIFVDLKLHDIPHQVRGAAASITLVGADMLTVHASGGLQMMQQAKAGVIEAAETSGLMPIILAVTVLTSTEQKELSQLGIGIPVAKQVANLAELAQQAGLDGIVSSAQEAAELRQLLGDQATIVTPGVRPANADTQDQKRVATPKSALESGASHLVIGRPITQAADPRQAFIDIVRSIDNE
jgi:orotidine-5'-phosphate decarboxylase